MPRTSLFYYESLRRNNEVRSTYRFFIENNLGRHFSVMASAGYTNQNYMESELKSVVVGTEDFFGEERTRYEYFIEENNLTKIHSKVSGHYIPLDVLAKVRIGQKKIRPTTTIGLNYLRFVGQTSKIKDIEKIPSNFYFDNGFWFGNDIDNSMKNWVLNVNMGFGIEYNNLLMLEFDFKYPVSKNESLLLRDTFSIALGINLSKVIKVCKIKHELE